MATRSAKSAKGRPTREAALRRIRALERMLARLSGERKTERTRHARQIAALRRAADRRLAMMLREIASLRHHEARAAALERLVAERDAALARAHDEEPPGTGESPSR
jgi:hypothetical protein